MHKQLILPLHVIYILTSLLLVMCIINIFISHIMISYSQYEYITRYTQDYKTHHKHAYNSYMYVS